MLFFSLRWMTLTIATIVYAVVTLPLRDSLLGIILPGISRGFLAAIMMFNTIQSFIHLFIYSIVTRSLSTRGNIIITTNRNRIGLKVFPARRKGRLCCSHPTTTLHHPIDTIPMSIPSLPSGEATSAQTSPPCPQSMPSPPPHSYSLPQLPVSVIMFPSRKPNIIPSPRCIN